MGLNSYPYLNIDAIKRTAAIKITTDMTNPKPSNKNSKRAGSIFMRIPIAISTTITPKIDSIFSPLFTLFLPPAELMI
ncbi:hypothetical protein JWG39_15455 [Desulforhopalus vacuolatus]|uniref:hypothetical protein n=1 Tax=Desulforhopalus vacuolatus TaxID=40414 RepID=UPI001963EBBB|nr:hypothetical protein [Desulforhopalus vacuolatus]MBM9521216.1 hypothetical protein [Desulforhopalus vacuolatus]